VIFDEQSGSTIMEECPAPANVSREHSVDAPASDRDICIAEGDSSGFEGRVTCQVPRAIWRYNHGGMSRTRKCPSHKHSVDAPASDLDIA
jgi:hypothetical protein